MNCIQQGFFTDYFNAALCVDYSCLNLWPSLPLKESHLLCWTFLMTYRFSFRLVASSDMIKVIRVHSCLQWLPLGIMPDHYAWSFIIGGSHDMVVSHLREILVKKGSIFWWVSLRDVNFPVQYSTEGLVNPSKGLDQNIRLASQYSSVWSLHFLWLEIW